MDYVQARKQLREIMQQKTVSTSRLKKVLQVINEEEERKTNSRKNHITKLLDKVTRQRKLLGGLQRDN